MLNFIKLLELKSSKSLIKWLQKEYQNKTLKWARINIVSINVYIYIYGTFSSAAVEIVS